MLNLCLLNGNCFFLICPQDFCLFLQYGNKCHGGIIAPWDFKVVTLYTPIKEWSSRILKKWNSEGLEMTICRFQLLSEAPAESFPPFGPLCIHAACRSGLQQKKSVMLRLPNAKPESHWFTEKKKAGERVGVLNKRGKYFWPRAVRPPPMCLVASDQLKNTEKWI